MRVRPLLNNSIKFTCFPLIDLWISARICSFLITRSSEDEEVPSSVYFSPFADAASFAFSSLLAMYSSISRLSSGTSSNMSGVSRALLKGSVSEFSKCCMITNRSMITFEVGSRTGFRINVDMRGSRNLSGAFSSASWRCFWMASTCVRRLSNESIFAAGKSFLFRRAFMALWNTLASYERSSSATASRNFLLTERLRNICTSWRRNSFERNPYFFGFATISCLTCLPFSLLR
mmetsp:Transcript_37931/g.61638  ORF Transcript_37931/g.61638 Transcript_37931/m.61638 type:complete len:233 (-) Transcript_37931:2146-2844(-)